MKALKKLFTTAAAAGWIALCGSATAADFPDRAVRIVVPFAPGGVTDLAARLIGQQLSTKWGQPVVIENKPGAGGIIGVESVMRSPADGYTILMASSGEVVIIPAISEKRRYDPVKDLVPIAMVTSTPYAWATNVNSGINSLQELVAAAKAKPGQLAYSSAGNGSTMHLATEQFASAAGLKLQHIPYRGGAPAAAALMAGDVPVGLVALSAIVPLLDSGRAKLLAVTSTKRTKLLPDVATISETGVLKDFESTIWTGLFAPQGTPAAIVAKIQADTVEALKDATVLERLASVGTDPGAASGAELTSRIRTEIEHVSKTAKEAGIRLD